MSQNQSKNSEVNPNFLKLLVIEPNINTKDTQNVCWDRLAKSEELPPSSELMLNQAS